MIFFRNFSIDGLLGDISWDKIRALTETFSSSKMAISIEGKPNAHRDGKCKQLFSIIDTLKNKCILCKFFCFTGTSEISSFQQGTCTYPVSIQGIFKYLQ